MQLPLFLLAQPVSRVYPSAIHQAEQLFSMMVQAELLGSPLLRQPQLDQSMLRFPEKVFGAIQTFQQFVPHLLPQWCSMAKSAAWQRKEGKNPEGGLNAKGRASAKAQGMNLKRPQPEGGSRRDSFCARMKGMKAKLTSAETARDPDSRINKSLRAWNC
jgi:hypothetical protein